MQEASSARKIRKTSEENQELLPGLFEVLPLIRRFAEESVVIKYGGSVLTDPGLAQQVMQDIVFLTHLGVYPVVVHGGGAEISGLMKKMAMKPQFVDGLRVTDEETVELAEMVLAGSVNKRLVGLLQQLGARAVGICGKDGALLVAERYRHMLTDGTAADLGFVGDVTTVNTELVKLLTENGYIPVVASIALGSGGETFNVNADTVAGILARELGSSELIFLTDVDGIQRNTRENSERLTEISAEDAYILIEEQAVTGGMVPKVRACLEAINGGVAQAHIINGSRPHAVLAELCRGGLGTVINSGSRSA